MAEYNKRQTCDQNLVVSITYLHQIAGGRFTWLDYEDQGGKDSPYRFCGHKFRAP